jgi:hypothetical protein
VTDGEVDDPDLALRLGEGLQESTAGEITTVTHSAADANIYRYGCTLPLVMHPGGAAVVDVRS